ncbi:MAG: hypothetical protein RLZZ480_238 [Candidatus Parcubacteria bacterium]|jgi:hypothetical protein
MQNYGPFDKPYGFFTWSGTKERLKGLLVLVESILAFMLTAACIALAEEVPTEFLKFFVYIMMGTPSFAAAATLVVLGSTWVYFPEFKPHWRKYLTW